MADTPPIPSKTGFLHALGRLIVFQLRLAADALRDLIMSPLSIAAFILDTLIQPPREQSFYQKLMLFGRHTDRWINLFEEFSEKTSYPSQYQDRTGEVDSKTPHDHQ